MHVVETPEELATLVRNEPRVRLSGGGTKTTTSSDAGVSVAKLSGVLKYDPGEFTFTALAGTRVDEIETLLAEKNQFLPFDAPFAAAGATLGGTVAVGMSGSGRYRFGGVRDFLLGAKIITGDGTLVTTGSQVVKNAAGFDFPKLMVGSLGCFGLMTELTFKVFPKPQRSATIVFETGGVSEAVELLCQLAGSNQDFACLDLDANHRVIARISGFQASVPLRAAKAMRCQTAEGKLLPNDEETGYWNECREFSWLPQEHHLVKLAITPRQIAPLASRLKQVPQRYSVGGNVAWIGWPANSDRTELEKVLDEVDCSGIYVTGPSSSPYLGKTGRDDARHDNPHQCEFAQRIRNAIDPQSKFSLH